MNPHIDVLTLHHDIDRISAWSFHRQSLLIKIALMTAFIGALYLSPSKTWACGGFFCNANNPVNQSAERILFARDTEAGEIAMHIQIQYEGPPTEFGWILPTAPGVETSISSEALFIALDRLYGPVFQLNMNYPDDCLFFDEAAEPNANGGSLDRGGVQVISREAIGPYDRAILSAERVEDLRAWLDEQQFQIPDELDPKFQPYIDAGAVFVVIKLLPGNDSGDIVPLNLTFPGTRPTIPIIPTSVAATPDMGIIAHVLDSARAIPLNYQHVQINEAAIDWANRGSNYADVVAQAADEAGGRAFATDFAGSHEGQVTDVLTPYTDAQLEAVAETRTLYDLVDVIPDRTNPDFQRVAASFITIPEGVERSDYFRCVRCYDENGDGDSPVDGAAVAERLRQEINPAYESLADVFGRLPYLTRLYTTLSADEMEIDPIFSINPDMDDVSNIHVAEAEVTCDDRGGITVEEITLADGRTYDAADATPTQRQEGETVRGADLPAAAVIEQTFEAGQPEIVMSMPEDMMTPSMDGTAGEDEEMHNGEDNGSETSSGGDSDDGKDEGCQQGRNMPAPLLLLVLLGGVSVIRRRVLA